MGAERAVIRAAVTQGERSQLIELELNPPDPVIEQVVTNRARATAGYGLFGLGLTLVATYWIDRVLTQRARRRAAVTVNPKETA